MDYRLVPIASDATPADVARESAEAIEREVHRNVFLGRLEDVLHKVAGWCRKNSLWPYNIGLSCC